MKVSYLWTLIKGTAEGVTLGAGIAGVAIAAVAAFITVPPFISIPVIVTAGVVFGAFALYTSHRDFKRRAAKDAIKAAARQQTVAANIEAKAAVQRIDMRLKEVERNVVTIPLENKVPAKRPLLRSVSYDSSNFFSRRSSTINTIKKPARKFDNDKRYGVGTSQLNW